MLGLKSKVMIGVKKGVSVRLVLAQEKGGTFWLWVGPSTAQNCWSLLSSWLETNFMSRAP